MTKKAFCVGINDYPYEGCDLNGCVNDAHAWTNLLKSHFDFVEANIELITDAEATKANIIAGIKHLLANAQANDVLVYTFSGHGTYVADTSGDEPTYDEAQCPYDSADNLILDDELRDLFSNVPEGVRLTIISDSCHSGTVTRASVGEIIPGRPTPDDRRVRFLNPAVRGEPILENPWRARPKSENKYPESSMKEILLSGCSAMEYSYDALINGVYHGAMTYHAIQAITDLDYLITYQQLHDRLGWLVKESGYPQIPQLEGQMKNKRRVVFS